MLSNHVLLNKAALNANMRERMLPGCKWEDWGPFSFLHPHDEIGRSGYHLGRKFAPLPAHFGENISSSLNLAHGDRENKNRPVALQELWMDYWPGSSGFSPTASDEWKAWSISYPLTLLKSWCYQMMWAFSWTQRAPGFLFTCSMHFNRLRINKVLIS